jgi:glycosyltransferase involved in cell wall biosynthesis
MRKIVFVNRFFFPDHSATSQLLADLAASLTKSNFTVEVVTSRQIYDNPASGLPSAETVDGVRVTRVWTSQFGRTHLIGRALDYVTFYITATWTLLWGLRADNILVAKTDPPLISVPAAIVARLRGARLINWLQDLFPEVAIALGVRGIAPLKLPLKALRNFSLRTAHMNVVLGERMAQALEHEGIPRSKIVIVPNWADGEQITSLAPRENRLRREWALDDYFVVGYSGNLGRAHDFRTILDAAALLLPVTDIRFVFIGGGAQLDWLERAAKNKGLSNLLFKPYQLREALKYSLCVPDVHLISLLPELEGYIVPSKFYGIAAAGRPSVFVGDPEGEIPKLLATHNCGYSVAVGDSQALAGYLKRLSADPQLAEELGREARNLFEKQYDKPIGCDRWSTLLQALKPWPK